MFIEVRVLGTVNPYYVPLYPEMRASIYASHILRDHADVRVNSDNDVVDHVILRGARIFKAADRDKLMKDVLKSGDVLHVTRTFGNIPSDQVGNGSILGPTQWHLTWSPFPVPQAAGQASRKRRRT